MLSSLLYSVNQQLLKHPTFIGYCKNLSSVKSAFFHKETLILFFFLYFPQIVFGYPQLFFGNLQSNFYLCSFISVITFHFFPLQQVFFKGHRSHICSFCATETLNHIDFLIIHISRIPFVSQRLRPLT